MARLCVSVFFLAVMAVQALWAYTFCMSQGLCPGFSCIIYWSLSQECMGPEKAHTAILVSPFLFPDCTEVWACVSSPPHPSLSARSLWAPARFAPTVVSVPLSPRTKLSVGPAFLDPSHFFLPGQTVTHGPISTLPPSLLPSSPLFSLL